MAREGDGERLEAIAAEENVSAANVRQRVSRLRRTLYKRWLLELAAVAVVALVVAAGWRLLGRPQAPVTLTPEPTVSPEQEPKVRPLPVEAPATQPAERDSVDGGRRAPIDFKKTDHGGRKGAVPSKPRSMGGKLSGPVFGGSDSLTP